MRLTSVTRSVQEGDGACHAYMDTQPYFTAFALHIITNLILFVLPFFILPYYTLDTRHKTSQIVILFTAGFIYVSATFGRLVISFHHRGCPNYCCLGKCGAIHRFHPCLLPRYGSNDMGTQDMFSHTPTFSNKDYLRRKSNKLVK